MKVNQLKVGAILSYFNIGLNCLVGIFITPIMVKVLGQSQYGLYQLIGAFVGYITVLDFGLGNTIIRYVAQYRQEKDKKGESNFLALIMIIYSIIFILTIIVGTILYFNLNKIFGKSLTFQELGQAKTMFIISVINIAISLPGGAFGAIVNAYEKYVYTRVITFVRLLIRTGLLIILLKFGYRALSIVILDSILNLLVILMNIYICKIKININIRLYKVNKSFLIEVLSYSFFIFLNVIFDQINWKVDQTIIGIKLSTAAVAIYAVGTTFSSLFMQFSGAIQGVFLPKVTKMVVSGASNDDLTNLMIRFGRVQGIILTYIFIGFALLGRQFIQLWIGDGYTDAWITALLVMCGLLIPLTENAGLAILHAKKKHQFYVLAYLLISIINMVLTIFAVDIMGIVGAAMMTMIGLIIGHVFFINWYYHFRIGLNMIKFFRELSNGILPVSIGSFIISYILIKIIHVTSWGMFVAQASLFTIVYFVCVWFFAANKYEKDLIAIPIKKFCKRRM